MKLMLDAENKAMADMLKILDKENIRFMDGRYSTGFADLNILQVLINSGFAEITYVSGIRFVKMKDDFKELREKGG